MSGIDYSPNAENQCLYEEIVKDAPCGILLIDNQANLVLLNRKARELYNVPQGWDGKTLQELNGLSLTESPICETLVSGAVLTGTLVRTPRWNLGVPQIWTFCTYPINLADGRGALGFIMPPEYQSNTERLNFQPTALEDILQQVNAAIFNLAVSKRIQITTYSENLNKITVDRKLIQKALLSVLTSIIDTEPVGGNLTIKVKRKKDDQSSVVIEIVATGSGVHPKFQETVFSRSYFLSGEEGLLHLSLAQQILALHKGAISYHKKKGPGALFTIILPKEPK